LASTRFYFFFRCAISRALDFLSCAEQQRDAPDARKRHDGINDSREQRADATADISDKIKLKQPDRAPVQRTDDHQDQRNSINHIHDVTSLSRTVL
jgi:hypothetical protein